MPRREVAWSAWNYMTQSSGASANVDQVCLTYWMNLLQHIPSNFFGPVLVTLNPLVEPEPALTQGRWEYRHPLYNAGAVRAQALLPRIQNTRGISYAGAWTKYGFHEDGFSSGLRAAVELGATLPFAFVDSTFARGRRPELRWTDHLARVMLAVVQCFVVIGAAVASGVLGVAGLGRRRKVD